MCEREKLFAFSQQFQHRRLIAQSVIVARVGHASCLFYHYSTSPIDKPWRSRELSVYLFSDKGLTVFLHFVFYFAIA